jgi:hypothetical protein
MFRHRLAPEADYYRLPELPAPTIRPQGFALCTIAVIPGCTAVQWAEAQQLYVVAMEHAQASARPSILERDWYAFWN